MTVENGTRAVPGPLDREYARMSDSSFRGFLDKSECSRLSCIAQDDTTDITEIT